MDYDVDKIICKDFSPSYEKELIVGQDVLIKQVFTSTRSFKSLTETDITALPVEHMYAFTCSG